MSLRHLISPFLRRFFNGEGNSSAPTASGSTAALPEEADGPAETGSLHQFRASSSQSSRSSAATTSREATPSEDVAAAGAVVVRRRPRADGGEAKGTKIRRSFVRERECPIKLEENGILKSASGFTVSLLPLPAAHMLSLADSSLSALLEAGRESKRRNERAIFHLAFREIKYATAPSARGLFAGTRARSKKNSLACTRKNEWETFSLSEPGQKWVMSASARAKMQKRAGKKILAFDGKMRERLSSLCGESPDFLPFYSSFRLISRAVATKPGQERRPEARAPRQSGPTARARAKSATGTRPRRTTAEAVEATGSGPLAIEKPQPSGVSDNNNGNSSYNNDDICASEQQQCQRQAVNAAHGLRQELFEPGDVVQGRGQAEDAHLAEGDHHAKAQRAHRDGQNGVVKEEKKRTLNAYLKRFTLSFLSVSQAHVKM